MRLSFYMTAGIAMAIANPSDAGQIVRKTLQQKARESDTIVIAEVASVRNTGIQDPEYEFERWEAECTLHKVICGQETNHLLKVTFFRKPGVPSTSLPEGDLLEPGKTFVLFLRRDRAGLSLLSPWDKEYDLNAAANMVFPGWMN